MQVLTEHNKLMKNNEEPVSKIRQRLRETVLFLLDVLYNATVIIILVVLIRTFLISPFRVVGSSMADTLQNKEFILIDKLSYLAGDVDRGDPVVFFPPPVSKDTAKFEETARIDDTGTGRLYIDKLSGDKETSYCENDLLSVFWFCSIKPRIDDIVYYAPQERQIGRSAFETNWVKSKSFKITKKDIKNGYLEIEGGRDQNYSIRIYDSRGKDYFVKRIIGVPGDTVKIENGRVYIKGPNETSFTEINESFLSQENYQKTYINQRQRKNVYEVPEGFYFVLGDNRNHSNDSRSWLEPITQNAFPFVPEANITGKVLVVLWPVTNFRFISSADF